MLREEDQTRCNFWRGRGGYEGKSEGEERRAVGHGGYEEGLGSKERLVGPPSD